VVMGCLKLEHIDQKWTPLKVVHRALGAVENEDRNSLVLKDHLGSVRVEFKDDGTGTAVPTNVTNYYPFGLPWDSDTDTRNNWTYTGQELQRSFDLGVMNYGARFYDPSIGRFMSVDPHADSYLNLSPYNYVANNPLISIDPDGRDIIITNCDCELTDQFLDIVNSNFNGQFRAYTEGYGENSVRVRVESTEGGGDLSKLSTGQQEFYNSFNDLAEVKNGEINIELVSGDNDVHTGRYSTGQIDVADLEQWPVLDPTTSSQDGPTQAGKVDHELREQYFKQVVDGNRGENVDGFGSDNSGNHGAAINYEDRVNGNSRRGNTYTKPDGTQHRFSVGFPKSGVISVSKKKLK